MNSELQKDEEVLRLHRELAAEKLRADQGWARYESANADRNALRAEKAAAVQPVAAQQHAQAAQSEINNALDRADAEDAMRFGAQAALSEIEDPIIVPRGLLGAACHAI